MYSIIELYHGHECLYDLEFAAMVYCMH